MRIHLPGDPNSFVEKWIGNNASAAEHETEANESNLIRLNLETFKEKTLRHIVFLQSLGLIDDEQHGHANYSQSSQRTSSRSIVFGHKHWELIQAICWGIRVSIGNLIES